LLKKGKSLNRNYFDFVLQKKVLLLLFIFLSSLLFGCGEENHQMASISIFPSDVKIGVGKTYKFYATAYDSRGRTLAATFTWSASAGIGTIDQDGNFTAANSPASGYVYASADSLTGQAEVEITNKGDILGAVKNTRLEEVSGIKVYLGSQPTLYDISDSEGEFSITDVPPGDYIVISEENVNYLSATSPATVAAGEITTVSLTLYDRLGILSEGISGSPITISGQVQNYGPTTVTGANVIYLFYDVEGYLIGSGQATLGDFAPGEVKSFFIAPFPSVYSYSRMERRVGGESF
jgi:hypothetical protein